MVKKSKPGEIPLEEIRKRVVRALFSDEQLLDDLVLKGGNALELVHRVVSRGSIDIDLSIPNVFENPDDVAKRIREALVGEFQEVGLTVFDYNFQTLPPGLTDDATPWWGGYRAEFKLISTERERVLGGNLEDMQRQAHPIDDHQGRTFKVDISKHEYCDGKIKFSLDGRTIYVYSLEMCVIEKLRALCQQMPDYAPTENSNKRPRARDFYDIYSAVTRAGLDLSLPENAELCRSIFAAKRVPLTLLGRIEETREYHRLDWDAVQIAIGTEVLDFETYFDFVVEEAAKLEALWKE
jgi:nucleotidyltransferase AbiEii toxin of type IV toxin-antitoxin system